MLSRRFLATAIGSAALIGAAGLAVLPGAASARLVASSQATVHPVAAADIAKPGGPIVPATVAGHASAQAAGGSFSVARGSLNWSGYAVASTSKFTYAQSRFVEPTITCTGSNNTWSSNWVGLDGAFRSDQTVEQTGTAAHCGKSGNMTPIYQAWYEMYPAGSVNVFSVSPGDTINTSVSFSNGKFTLTVSDLTSGKHATHTAKCGSCKRESAEWIVERPELCTTANCFLTHLANFGTTSLSAKVRVAGVNKVQGIPNFKNYNYTMYDTANTQLASVGKVSSNAFTATWEAPGNTQLPPPPTG